MEKNFSNIQNVYQLSPAQEGILFHYLLDKNSPDYFIQMVFKIDNGINVNLLQRSFNDLVKRYDILRLSFLYESHKQPLQVVLKERMPEFEYFDFTHLKNPENQAAVIEKFKTEDIDRSFDLSVDSLFRVKLIGFPSDCFYLIWSTHHIIMDGWCLNTLSEEFFKIHKAHCDGLRLNLQEPKQYWAYIKWLGEQDKVCARRYWKNYLEGFNQRVGMPATTYRGQKSDKVQLNFNLGDERTTALRQLAARLHVTLYSLMQGIWSILLYRYTSIPDIVFGSVVSGRPPEIDGIESMIGLFINTLPVRVKFVAEDNFRSVVTRIQQSALESDKFQYVSLADIQAESRLKNDIFDHILVFENYPIEPRNEFSDNGVSADLPDFKIIDTFEQTHYPLTLIIGPGQNVLLKFQFDQNVYTSGLIARIAGQIKSVCDELIINPELPIGAIEVLSRDEKLLLSQFSRGKDQKLKRESVTELFETQSAGSGDRIVLVDGEMHFSCSYVDEMADRIADAIEEKCDLRPNDVVGLCLPRNHQLVMCILGIVRAHAVFMPIDVRNPESRTSSLLKDANVRCIITNPEVYATVSDYNSRPEISISDLWVDVCLRKAPEGKKGIKIDRDNTDERMLYVMYTSGSTGQPKGVLVPERGIINRIQWMRDYCSLNSSDVILHKTQYTFDVSMWEIFMPLCFGAKMIICAEDTTYDSEKLQDLIKKEHVTVLHFVPSLLNDFLNTTTTDLKSLKHVICSGEGLRIDVTRLFFERMGARLHNLYGPTEASIDVTFYEVHPEDKEVPIGKPIWNTGIEIRDRSQNLLPLSGEGEIYISGIGLAEGYLNRIDLSDNCFVYCSDSPGKRMYKTGDIGRWRDDGNLLFLGRIDDQIKIHGQRIELGEIEQVMMQHPEIDEAVLKYIKVDDGKLAGFYTSKSHFDSEILANFLKARLPSYMIPSILEQIDIIPRTRSGKINRKDLPDVDLRSLKEVPNEPPRNETERKLISIMEDILDFRPISINQSFFDLGGHSLKAIRLVSQIKKTFDISINVRDVFAHRTAKQLASQLKHQPQERFERIGICEEQDHYPLSFPQKGIWITSQIKQAKHVYTLADALRIKHLNVSALTNALGKLVQQHEALRTIFVTVDGVPRQKVLSASVAFKPEYFETSSEEELESYVAAATKLEFNLSQGPLIKAQVVRVADDTYYFFFFIHHIIVDAWSFEILIRDLFGFYNGSLTEIGIKHDTIQFKDYAVWQNRMLSEGKFNGQRKYWNDQFEDGVPMLNLPLDFPRPLRRSYLGGSSKFVIDSTKSIGIKALVSQNDATLFSVLISLVNALLYCYTGQTDIVIGTPTAGRAHVDLENQVGLFLNNLPIRVKFKKEDSFKKLLSNVFETCVRAFDNQHYPYDLLIQDLQYAHEPSRLMPLFDVVVVLQNMDYAASTEGVKDFSFERRELSLNKVAADLRIEFEALNNEITMAIDYSDDLFTQAWVQRFYSHFITILDSVIESESVLLKDIDFITDEEKDWMENTNTYTARASCNNLASLFEKKVISSPDAIALTFGHLNISYYKLNTMANGLAKYLREHYQLVGDDIVGVLVDKSEWTIICMLGILKSGASYLPIDHKLPTNRINYIIDDASVAVLIANSWLLNKVGQFRGNLIAVDIQMESFDQTEVNVPVINQPQDSAYVLYTSGSTGTPKGVIVEHRGIINTALDLIDRFRITSQDKMLQFSNSSFDASIAEIGIALSAGGSLVLMPEEKVLKPKTFVSFLQEQQVSACILPPSYLATLNIFPLAYVKKIITAGEKAIVKNAVEYANYATYYNAYGPTECSICVSTHRIHKESGYYDRIPIGMPISNIQAQIVDSEGRLMPVGIEGEIIVSGVGVARGYLNRPELTYDKFSNHPSDSTKRLFRTGDIAKRTDTGELDFIGRNDSQVKVRGYRIELSEIEKVLLEHPAVKQALVIAKDQKQDAYLVAYCLLDGDEKATVDDLREHARGILPEYMMPACFVFVDRFPTTSTGKVDSKALLELSDDSTLNHRPVDLPTNDVEIRLLKIWSRALKSDKLGVNDNFFNRGGHSLKAIQVLANVYEEFGAHVDLGEFFLHSTIRDLSRIIEDNSNEKQDRVTRIEEQDYYDLTPAQQSLWYQNQLISGVNPFVIHQVFQVSGRIDLPALESAVNSLMRRHESLGTIFFAVNGEPKQKVRHSCLSIDSIKENGFGDLEFRQRYLESEVSNRMPLDQGPLIKIRRIATDDDEEYLVFTIHHIISDGWSMNILVKELSQLYDEFSTTKRKSLPDLPIQYKDYASWFNEALSEPDNKDKWFWMNEFKTEIPRLSMITDFVRSDDTNVQGDVVLTTLDVLSSSKVHKLCEQENVTLFVWSLAIVNILLYRYTGQTDLVIGTPVSGRDHPDLQHQVGYFLNSLPIRNKFHPDDTFGKVLSGVQKQVVSVFKHQKYPVEKLIDDLRLKHSPMRSPLYDVLVMAQKFSDPIEDSLLVDNFFNLDYNSNTSKYDLTFAFQELNQAKDIQIAIEYSKDLFKRETIKRLAQDLIAIVVSMNEDLNVRISAAEILEVETAGVADDFLRPSQTLNKT